MGTNGVQSSMEAAAPDATGHGAPPSRGAPDARHDLSVQDLAELMSAINDVTGKLQKSHDVLRAEVARLNVELREANAQLERSRRLAALGEMAAGISHEVRNPLASIRLYARMLEQDLTDRPEQRGVATKILRAATSLDAIVGDVLTFAREFRPNAAPLNVRSLIERALESSDPRSHPAWREIAIVVECDASITFEGDTHLVQQALVNVVRNALEAMAEGGVGGSHELWIGGERVAERVVIRVRDTGPGVSAETVKRMFNPFFTTRSTGTGLGLSIVHRIVDAHGGVVRVRNNRDIGGGRGALVELEFPVVFSGKLPDTSEALDRIAEGKPPRSSVVDEVGAGTKVGRGRKQGVGSERAGKALSGPTEGARSAKVDTQHHRQEQR